MKTKRITMIIELISLVVGILLSFYFEFKSNLSIEMKNLICNLFIGLSTGGLVAFLIEVPQAIATKKKNISSLVYNSLYLYVFFCQLAGEIKISLLNKNEKYNNNFTKYYFEKIKQYIYPILTLDENLFYCKIKNKEINKLREGLNYFMIVNIQAPLTYKYCSILIQEKNNDSFEVENGMVVPELTDLLVNISYYIKLVDSVMKILSNKKQLKKWIEDTMTIQKSIIQHPLSKNKN